MTEIEYNRIAAQRFAIISTNWSVDRIFLIALKAAISLIPFLFSKKKKTLADYIAEMDALIKIETE